jgi:hypothetical protein
VPPAFRVKDEVALGDTKRYPFGESRS